jgi:hypothetical protein
MLKLQSMAQYGTSLDEDGHTYSSSFRMITDGQRMHIRAVEFLVISASLKEGLGDVLWQILWQVADTLNC